MVREVLSFLAPAAGGIILDGTVGLGGHAEQIASRLGPEGMLIGLDLDPAHVAHVSRRLAGATCRVELRQGNFADLDRCLEELNVPAVDGILADLGISSDQLGDPHRGFSFQHDGPLDMRMDPQAKVTAADLVNRLRENELGDLIFFNSQERASRRIARAICAARRDGRITTTGQLVDLICRATNTAPNSHKMKIHPATRTFQALRIAVNSELENLKTLLARLPDKLRLGGRAVLISFHSLEDGAVKESFREGAKSGVYELLTKRPVVAGEEERALNPRSRSAKLRAVKRIG